MKIMREDAIKKIIMIIVCIGLNILFCQFINFGNAIDDYLSGYILSYLLIILISVIYSPIVGLISGLTSLIFVAIIQDKSVFNAIYTVITGVSIGFIYEGYCKDYNIETIRECLISFTWIRIMVGFTSALFRAIFLSLSGKTDSLGRYYSDDKIFSNISIQYLKSGISTFILGIIILLIYLIINKRIRLRTVSDTTFA